VPAFGEVGEAVGVFARWVGTEVVGTPVGAWVIPTAAVGRAVFVAVGTGAGVPCATEIVAVRVGTLVGRRVGAAVGAAVPAAGGWAAFVGALVGGTAVDCAAVGRTAVEEAGETTVGMLDVEVVVGALAVGGTAVAATTGIVAVSKTAVGVDGLFAISVPGTMAWAVVVSTITVAVF